MHLVRGDAKRGASPRAPHRLKGAFDVGGQEQFYLEGQIAYAIPQRGRRHAACTARPSIRARCSTWSRTRCGCRCAPACMSNAGAWAAASAARNRSRRCSPASPRSPRARLQRRSSCALDRDDDFLSPAGATASSTTTRSATTTTAASSAPRSTMVSRAGYSADLSGPVMTRALCHFDNAYWLPDVAMHGYSGKTNTQSNTAFRGFGGPQGAIAIENILDDDRAQARQAIRSTCARVNFYGNDERNVTPYGQTVDDNIIHELVDELAKAERLPRSAARRSRAFNAASPVLKRGIALTPVKFGISFNVDALQPGRRAGARLHRRLDPGEPRRHRDGPGPEHQGGAGGGARARRAACAACACTATDTQQGRQHVGHRGLDRRRPERQGGAGRGAPDPRAAGRLRGASATAATPSDVRFANDTVDRQRQRDRASASWSREAYMARVQLWSDGFYATPGLHWDRDTLQGQPFFYFAYGAAVSEVRRRHAHRRMEAAARRHPARRRHVAQPGDRHRPGRRRVHPGHGLADDRRAGVAPDDGPADDARAEHLQDPDRQRLPAGLQRARCSTADNVEDTIHRSKAVGEPPLLLPFSVFFAIRDAVVGGRRPPRRSAAATRRRRAKRSSRQPKQCGRPCGLRLELMMACVFAPTPTLPRFAGEGAVPSPAGGGGLGWGPHDAVSRASR